MQAQLLAEVAAAAGEVRAVVDLDVQAAPEDVDSSEELVFVVVVALVAGTVVEGVSEKGIHYFAHTPEKPVAGLYFAWQAVEPWR